MDRFFDQRLPALVDALECLKQPNALTVGRPMRVELAHRVERLAQRVVPLGHVTGVVGQVVQDRHARACGQTQELDLDPVLFLDPLGAVHDQDDRRALRHRFQERTVVGKEGVRAMRGDEGAGQLALAALRLEPLQDRVGVLKTRRIDELDHGSTVDDDRIDVRLGRGAGAFVDRDQVVLGQGRDHGGLAGIRVSHDRQSRNLPGHQSSPSSSGGASISKRR